MLQNQLQRDCEALAISHIDLIIYCAGTNHIIARSGEGEKF